MTATITRTTRNRARLTALLTTTALIGNGLMPSAITVLSGTSALAAQGGVGGHGGAGGSVIDSGGAGGSGGNGSAGNGTTVGTGGAGGASPGANGADGTDDPVAASGGGGGAGGLDIIITTPTTSGTLTAGAGGTGGNGGSSDGTGYAGGGGGGGGGGDIYVDTLNNSGVLTGGAGGAGGNAGGGGLPADPDPAHPTLGDRAGGGTGGWGGSVIVTGTGTMGNSGTITGGAGGVGGVGYTRPDWGDGNNGAGGTGIVFNASGVTFTNTSSGTITGGASTSSGTSSASGGSGIIAYADMSIINAGSISGGTGTSSQGVGIWMRGGSLQLENSGTIRGTNGVQVASGAGELILINSGAIDAISAGVTASNGATITNLAGDGITTGLIKGFYGLYLRAGTVSNYGAIVGGVIMTGGTVTNHAGNGVTTGVITGDSGIANLGHAPGLDSPMTITNAGAIFGTSSAVGYGVGIETGTGGGHTVTNEAGDGVTTGIIKGVNYGIKANSATAITNAGTIDGGLIGIWTAGGGSSVFNNGTISSAGTAIQFDGNDNTLTLGTSSIINGNVVANGTSNALQLGGTGSATFDVSQIGASAQYQGFDTFAKTGSSTWTLIGTPTEATSWSLNGGTLSVASDAVLGTGHAALSFNGGILQVTGTGFTSTTRNINWGAGGGGFDIADPANNFTVSQTLTGSGGLTKRGAGTLTLTGINTYGGGTTVTGGLINFASAANLGSGNITLDGGGLQWASGNTTDISGRLNAIGTNGATFDTNGNNVTFATGLTGSGGLTKAGAGKLTLSGNNTYTGATTVSAGTLDIWGHVATSAITIGSAAALFNAGTSAGNATINISSNGELEFRDTSTAGHAAIIVNGTMQARQNATLGYASVTNNTRLYLQESSSAGNATIVNNHNMNFYSSSTAANATIINNGVMDFNSTANAGSAHITNNVGSRLWFYNDASAATATIVNSGFLGFQVGTAASALITNNSGGTIEFQLGATAANARIANAGTINFTTAFGSGGTAGNAQLINEAAGAVIDFSASVGLHADNKVEAGSLAGNGTFYLGANELTVGSNNLTTTVTGTIADGGAAGGTGASLVKTGTGTLTLTGTNTYSGGTTIAGGVLSVSSDSNLGIVPLHSNDSTGALLFNGGTLRVTGTSFNSTLRAVSFDIGGGSFDIVEAANTFALGSEVPTSLSGRGGLTKLGAGTLVLQEGIASYEGITDIGAGTLRVGEQMKLSASSTHHIAAGARLDLGGTRLTQAIAALTGNGTVTNSGNRASNLGVGFGGVSGTFAGTIEDGSGGVRLTVSGAGTATLTGTNTYTGGTTIADGGTLQLGEGTTGGSIVGNVANGGTLKFNRADTMTFSGAITDYSYGSGAGLQLWKGALVQTGTGHTILAGENSYTGATTVERGTLSVNGSIASSSLTTVNAGGTLGGTGTVGHTLINGGTLAPGHSIGTITVRGNLAFTSGAQYLVEVSPTGSDRTQVTGTASLAGTVQASFAGSYVEKKYTIVSAAGGLGGSTFGAVVHTNLPENFKTALSYDGNNAYLDLSLAFVASSDKGISGNQAGVGHALVNYFDSHRGIPLVYGGLTASGLTQVSGETATGSQQTTVNAMTQFMGVMMDPFTVGRSETPVPMAYAPERSTSPRDAYAAITKAMPRLPVFEERWSVRASGFGGSQSTDGNAAAGSNATTSRIYGVAAGADVWLSPTTLAGIAMAGGATTFSVAQGGSGQSDLVQVGGFVRHTIGAGYISAAAAYGWQDVTTDRTVTVAGTDRLRARFKANSFAGRIEIGSRFVESWTNGIGLTPYAALQVTAIDLPSYAESVATGSNAFALSYTGKTVTAPRTELGLRSDKAFALDGALLTLRGRAAWAHDTNTDRNAQATFQALPGASFVVNGAAAARNAALTSASAEIAWTNGFSFAATFDGEFSETTRSYAGKGVVRYAW